MISFLSAFLITAYAQTATPTNFDVEDPLTIETVWDDLDDQEDFEDDRTVNASDLADITEIVDYFRELAKIDSLSLDTVEAPLIAAEQSFSAIAPYDFNSIPGTVAYGGVFNGYDCTFITDYDNFKRLNIVDGILVNTSTASITGRLFYPGETVGPGNIDIYVYTLPPYTSSTANAFRYGTINYRTRYYYNNSASNPGVTSQQMFGNFAVTDSHINYQPAERVLYTLYVLIFIIGIGLLWKH